MTQADSKQEELALSADVDARWPGRTRLYVKEVAKHLDVTDQHVINLIEAGELFAVNVASDIQGGTTDAGRNKSKFWRVPVFAVKDFEAKRGNHK